MSINRAIINASPLIVLFKSQQAELLPQLFPEVCLAIVDDRAARRCGVALGITTLGTGGVLLLAKRRGLILEVAPRIQALRDAGLWLSEQLVQLLKQQAGE